MNYQYGKESGNEEVIILVRGREIDRPEEGILAKILFYQWLLYEVTSM
jgi:hypothetical protein